MNLSRVGRRILASGVVASLLFAAPAWALAIGQSHVETTAAPGAPAPARGVPPAQSEGTQSVQSEGMQSAPTGPTDPSYVAPYLWNVSVGVGTASGANPIGSIADEDAEKIFSFDIDSGVLFNARVARRVWWRLGIEGEFGYASPGVLITETNLQGFNVQTEPWADFSMGYGSASLRVDLFDARVTPFLLGGIAVVFSSYDERQQAVPADSTDTSTSSVDPGFLFGGGLDVRIVENVYLRGDVKGLRSNVDAPLLSRGILEQFVDDRSALSTQVLWTLGVAVRF